MERSEDRAELAALVAAVSLAADLASGVTLEHGLRTCPASTESLRRPLRIAVSARHPSPGARVAPAVRASLERAAELLRGAGHTVASRGRSVCHPRRRLARPLRRAAYPDAGPAAVPTGTWSGQGWVRAMLGVGNWLFTTPWNRAGLPAASVPFGSDQGLPLGLQIVAPAGREQVVLARAAQIEQVRP